MVVDGSTDNTVEILKEFQAKLPALKIIVQENGGRSKVKNRGAQEASGNLLIFYDDDMEPSKTSIHQHESFHRLNERAILGGNPLELKESTKTDFQNYRAEVSERWLGHFSDGVNKLNEDNCFLSAANMSVSSSTFKLMSGFNEELFDAEDQDFALRCLDAQISVFFDKTNVAIHHDPITCARYIERTRQYGLARKTLGKLHPNLTKLQLSEVQPLKKLFYWFFTFRCWRYWVDKNYFLILPVGFRYKLYSIIVHASGVIYPNSKKWLS